MPLKFFPLAKIGSGELCFQQSPNTFLESLAPPIHGVRTRFDIVQEFWRVLRFRTPFDDDTPPKTFRGHRRSTPAYIPRLPTLVVRLIPDKLRTIAGDARIVVTKSRVHDVTKRKLTFMVLRAVSFARF